LRTIDVEPQSGLLDSRAKNTRKLRRESRKVYRFVCRPDAPGFDARKVEQRIDELQQPQTVTLDEIDLLIRRAGLRVGRTAQLAFQFLQRPQHQRERRAKLMADIREERSLDTVDFRQSLGPLALFFIGARFGDGRRDLVCRKLIKAFVLFIQFQS
jgi:hypothetical protein